MTLSGAAARRKKSPEAHETDRPALLLAWYDRHRRQLPWRAPPGQTSDPYRVWLSEIMLQQTTVKAVGPYFEKFTARWPTVAALGAAADASRSVAGSVREEAAGAGRDAEPPLLLCAEVPAGAIPASGAADADAVHEDVGEGVEAVEPD